MQPGTVPFDLAAEAVKRFFSIEQLKDKMEKAIEKLGRVNILVAGKTGVGKTTLVNAVFGSKVGLTGVGAPITAGITWYDPPGLPLRLCDTRGLELAAYTETLAALEAELLRSSTASRVQDRLHLAWICISERSARIEDAEQQVAKLCSKHGVAVIVVVTQAFGKEAFVTAIRKLIPEAKAVVPVMAEAEDAPPFPSHGLLELVTETERLLPQAVEGAFTAAQRVNLDAKRSAATKIVWTAATAAAAAALLPIPLAAPAVLLPAQLAMVTQVAAAMGVAIDLASMLALSASLAGGIVASSGSRLLFGELLKFVPGAGTAFGAAVEIGIAGATTYGLGIGLIEFLTWFNQGNGRMPYSSELEDGFVRFWKARSNKEISPPTEMPMA